ncbi:diaminopropionate ammonia-lyase [Thalassovita mediterranea]|jgi:diaminopropionate ammonia-lyase|uniref:Putative diaminopropionate ammonia-lyase n=1 Tax=Thalassovita mediterranea TaxID=340021 RepID=A0A0P1GSZ4_9RHOB|nr:diaminopropionate ammonia-lyase [Thalassovita mediterranea]CUH85980.1 Putative diaminopropionate ammonia-lyase [Thalassovita mediterranea]SIS32988.1 diaminopropionate ammonia-lyase [Thalassovita mediterranea]
MQTQFISVFAAANIQHVAGAPHAGRAAFEVLSEQDFDRAVGEITSWQGYAATPLVSLAGLADQIGVGRIDYKHEGPRFGLGSFKALGGAYAAMRVLQRELTARLGHEVSLSDIRDGRYSAECAQITLVSATDGNHGRSLAWGCQRVGAPCRIYIHAEVSEGRAEAMRALGADVVRISGDYDASVDLAKSEAAANGWFVVSDTSWPGYSEPPRDVMAGYGVMTREACDAMAKPPTHVFLQGGVGGLAASVAAALRQYYGADAPRVIIVEPELAACLYESAQSGTATTVAIAEETIMAGLSCGEPSEMAWQILHEEAADFLTIPDSIVAPTVRLLARRYTGDPLVEAGESAVAGLAALIAARQSPDLSQALGLDGASRVLLIGSEGVTDPDIFAAIMAEAEAEHV